MGCWNAILLCWRGTQYEIDEFRQARKIIIHICQFCGDPVRLQNIILNGNPALEILFWHFIFFPRKMDVILNSSRKTTVLGLKWHILFYVLIYIYTIFFEVIDCILHTYIHILHLMSEIIWTNSLTYIKYGKQTRSSKHNLAVVMNGYLNDEGETEYHAVRLGQVGHITELTNFVCFILSKIS